MLSTPQAWDIIVNNLNLICTQEPGIGWTPIFFALLNNNIKILDLLLTHGADVSIEDKVSDFYSQTSLPQPLA